MRRRCTSIRVLTATIQSLVLLNLLETAVTHAERLGRLKVVREMISRMYFSFAGSSSCDVAFTTATSSSGAMALETLAIEMLVWSFTAPKAFRIVLPAIGYRIDGEMAPGTGRRLDRQKYLVEKGEDQWGSEIKTVKGEDGILI